MFPGPWGFPFPMGGPQREGRRRRRRSSDSSRSRDRRRRRQSRTRRSRSPTRSERSQPQTAPLPPPPNVISLPQPQAGYVWQQVPAVPQMMPVAQAPKAIVPSDFQQSWDQKGHRASSWQSQPRQKKPWNKYYGKDAWGRVRKTVMMLKKPPPLRSQLPTSGSLKGSRTCKEPRKGILRRIRTTKSTFELYGPPRRRQPMATRTALNQLLNS